MSAPAGPAGGAGPAGPTGLVGLVLSGPTPRVGVEPFIMELIAGAEQVLHGAGLSVLLLVVADLAEELAAYRRWSADRTVEAVVVVDLVLGDERPGVLTGLGLPFVLAGHAEDATGCTSVVTDDAGAAAAAVELLASLGHERVGRVSGPAAYVHTAERTRALRAAGQRLGVATCVAEADYTAEGGVRAALELLGRPAPPTALVFDNDVMAVAVLEHLTRRGVDVPGELSLLATDDSPLCELAVPALSALSIDVHERGARLGRAVLRVLGGEPPRTLPGPPVRLVRRASTAPAPAGDAQRAGTSGSGPTRGA
ncbi:LacI family DNA-binding transcriptional regulator [Kineococcus sp. G2]|uniref:LacI family DNA-binding transcriptional regulator n=1 Tax=Kineococcus sp. G2 TaxID=3127484 RepID=UPI00301D89C3